jgi:hypothetical protein
MAKSKNMTPDAIVSLCKKANRWLSEMENIAYQLDKLDGDLLEKFFDNNENDFTEDFRDLALTFVLITNATSKIATTLMLELETQSMLVEMRKFQKKMTKGAQFT